MASREVILLIIGAVCTTVVSQLPRRRFEYKYSFKGPHIARTNGEVYYWNVGGNAIASSDQVRLTASLRSQKGHMSTKAATTFPFWQIDVAFRISGRARVGADGLAIWFTKDPIKEGPVYGAGDHWTGLGIFLDSFDNDGRTNNPYVLAMLNNGTVSYDHSSDGYDQKLAGCLRDFRNRPKHVRARIIYHNKDLQVYFNTILDKDDEAYELCLSRQGVELPESGHFGLSAATGGLADDHDVLSFLAFSLDAPSDEKKEVEEKNETGETKFDDDELAKLQKEFEQYNKVYEEKHDSFVKDHPDLYTDIEDETYEDRTMGQVMKGQTDIITLIGDVSSKVEKLQRDVELAQAIGGGGSEPGPPGDNNAAPSKELYRILAENQNRILQQLETLKANQRQQGGAGQAASYEHGPGMIQMEKATSRLESMIERFETVQQQQQQLHEEREKRRDLPSSQEGGGSSSSSCVPMPYFALFVIAQVTTVIAFVVYRWKVEASAKKLF